MELTWHLLLGGAKHGNDGRVKRDSNEVFFSFSLSFLEKHAGHSKI
jgi:hypothetical protein